MSSRRSTSLLVATLLALVPLGSASRAAEPLTEDQQKQFKELDADFGRLEKLLQSLPDSQPRNETQRVYEGMQKRAAGLRQNFDQTRFDETRWEANFERQQLLLWLQEPRLKPLTKDGSIGPLNGLTAEEKESGWELLFNGKDLAGWRGYRLKGPPPKGWEVKDGLLHTVGKAETGVDLVTERKFTNFELMWEWRASTGANSGVKYFVTEDRPTAPGHEYQLLDDPNDPNRGRRTPAQKAGAFYDVIAPVADTPLKPAGEWNYSRLLVKGNHVEHWLNGRKVVSYDVGSPDVKTGIAQSKFKAEKTFGTKINGPILITYHASQTDFRNIKIRELK
jgi:hypothetical protein